MKPPEPAEAALTNPGRDAGGDGRPVPVTGDGVITILIVEDHVSFSQALDAVMSGEEDLDVVAQVQSADKAGAAAARTGATLAVVDLDLPDGSGVDAIAAIRRCSPGTACVVVSALRDDVECGRAVEAGATAVVHKSVDIVELLDVLRRVSAGETVLTADQATRQLKAVAAFREQERSVSLVRERLTEREQEILIRLAAGSHVPAIAEELGIEPATARTHIRNLLGKLSVSSRLEAVVKALRLGLVVPPRWGRQR